MRKWWALGAVIGMVGLVACNARPETVVSTSVDPTGGIHTAVVPASTPPKRKTDFITVTTWAETQWRDVVNGKIVQLEKGEASVDGFAYQLVPRVTYSDANGDGLEDAMAEIAVTTPKGATTTYLYLWQWSSDKKAAEQVPDPVGEYGNCTNALTKVAPGVPMGFEITEVIRDVYDGGSCATPPKHQFVRTVGVVQGGLVMTKPTMAYGGICYQTYRDPSELPVPTLVFVAPVAKSAVAAQVKNIYVSQPGYVDRAWPDHWVQVGWVTDDLKQRGIYWGVCGFARQ